MTPTSCICECRHGRWTKSDAKVRVISAKRASRSGKVMFFDENAASPIILCASSTWVCQTLRTWGLSN